VLPAGQTLTKAWCEAGVQTVAADVYHEALGVAPPPYQLAVAWVNPLQNFDNVLHAIWTLFQARARRQRVQVAVAGLRRRPPATVATAV